MAITVASVTNVFDGPKRIRFAQITLDSSYATGGETIAAGDLGLQKIDAVFMSGGDDGYVTQWDETNLKFLAYANATSTTTNPVQALSEVASGQDLSAVVFWALVVGN